MANERLVWGTRPLEFGAKLLAWGAPLTELLVERPTPEQVLVACARSMMLPSFPVLQAGAPELPSMVYAGVGAEELATFERTLTNQQFVVAIRAATYSDVVQCANDYYNKLRQFPGNRVRGVSGFTDGYGDDFNFLIRRIVVTVQR